MPQLVFRRIPLALHVCGHSPRDSFGTYGRKRWRAAAQQNAEQEHAADGHCPTAAPAISPAIVTTPSAVKLNQVAGTEPATSIPRQASSMTTTAKPPANRVFGRIPDAKIERQAGQEYALDAA